MRLAKSSIAVFGLAFVLLAGCQDAAPPPVEIYALGQNAGFAVGWAYDGEGVKKGTGLFLIHAFDDSNTGEAQAAVSVDSLAWTIRFTQFAEQAGKPFQNGGVAFNLEEHGETGNGDTSIPHVHAEVAAWGFATVKFGNDTVKDPYTGDATWVAHYMVITTGVRDDASGKVYNQAKSGPYDPAKPADGYAAAADNEIHLVLKSHAAAPTNQTALTPVTGSASNPMNNRQSKDFYMNKIPGTLANVTASVMSDLPAGSADLTFTFKDPGGKEVATAKATLETAGSATTGQASFTMDQIGRYTVDVEGPAVAADYSISGTVTPAGVFNFWFEDVMVGHTLEELGAIPAAPTTPMPPPPPRGGAPPITTSNP